MIIALNLPSDLVLQIEVEQGTPRALVALEVFLRRILCHLMLSNSWDNVHHTPAKIIAFGPMRLYIKDSGHFHIDSNACILIQD